MEKNMHKGRSGRQGSKAERLVGGSIGILIDK